MILGNCNIQSIGISGFTSVLKQYEGMPKSLSVIGVLPNNRPPAVAIIGSRKPTDYGKEVTYRLAYDLAKKGIVVVSGLAYGIDKIAHQAALDAGGITIAVLANGLHRVYPAAHEALAKQIIQQGGALISEQQMGVDARKHHFLARNRIVSGLVDAVIVTEATDRSGTFSTVAHALTQNKEVFAVPGAITSLLSAGPNRLIQEGARVVLRTEDILEVIAPHLLPKLSAKNTTDNNQVQLVLGDTPLEMRIIQSLQKGSKEIDTLISEGSDPPAEVLQAVTEMELKGLVRVDAGKVILHF